MPMKCPKCDGADTFELIIKGPRRDLESLGPLTGGKYIERLYKIMENAMYAQCTNCGHELDGNALVDFLEHLLLDEGV